MAKKSRRRRSRKKDQLRKSKLVSRFRSRNTLNVEALEQRLLLAVDLVTENQSQAFTTGVEGLTEFSDQEVMRGS